MQLSGRLSCTLCSLYVLSPYRMIRILVGVVCRRHRASVPMTRMHRENRESLWIGSLVDEAGVEPATSSVQAILAEFGEIERFPNPKHLVSYAGLAPTVHGTGGRLYTGHISKQGSRWLSWILIEAAMYADRQPDRYRHFFDGSHSARVESSPSGGCCPMSIDAPLGTPPC